MWVYEPNQGTFKGLPVGLQVKLIFIIDSSFDYFLILID